MNSFFVCLFVLIVFLQTYSVNAGEMPRKLTVEQAEKFADGMKVNVKNIMENTSEYKAKYNIDIERCFTSSEDGLIELIPFSEEKMKQGIKDIQKKLVKELLTKGEDKLSETDQADQEDKLHYCVYLIKSPMGSCYHCHPDNYDNKSDIYGALSIAVPVN